MDLTVQEAAQQNLKEFFEKTSNLYKDSLASFPKLFLEAFLDKALTINAFVNQHLATIELNGRFTLMFTYESINTDKAMLRQIVVRSFNGTPKNDFFRLESNCPATIIFFLKQHAWS